MATNAIKAWGTTVSFDGVTLGEVTGISGSGSSRNIIRVFTCDSANETADKIAGGIDAGTITVGLIYWGSATGPYKTVDSKKNTGVLGSLVITYKDGSIRTGSALIQNVGEPSFSDPEGAIVAFDVTFDCSGEMEITDTAGGTASATISSSPSTSVSASPSSSAS